LRPLAARLIRVQQSAACNPEKHFAASHTARHYLLSGKLVTSGSTWYRSFVGAFMVSRLIAGVCSVIAVVACSGCGSQPSEEQVLLERDSLKVVAAKAFPKDLSCEIFVGAPKNPSFKTTGADGRVERATIDLGVRGPAVSLARKATQPPSYFLYLFLDQPNGVTALFDLNLDGEWDVKKTPDTKAFIRIKNEWVEVGQVDGIPSEKTTAIRGRTQFVFDKGKWISVPATSAS
jgi:hypothetical protein